jgi:protein-L-isoaspartate(D-aspartate) O-methyltransferase
MNSPQNPTDGAYIARVNMVESQIRPNRIYDTGVLTALLNVPREAFLPDLLRPVAYTDEALKIAPGRYMTQPLVLARLLEVAAIEPAHTVMVVGAGNGYSSAVVAAIARKVIAVEDHHELRQMAESTVGRLGIGNISFRANRLADGCADEAPYDAIVIDGAVAEIPHALMDQLADKGRLVAILARPGDAPRGFLVERLGSAFSSRIVFDGAAPILPGFEAKPEFAFA